eukprot:2144021-Pleurochrysis_carterae.AAC.1
MAMHGRGFPSTPDTDSEQGFRRAVRVATKARAQEAMRRSMHALRVTRRSRSGKLDDRASGSRMGLSVPQVAFASALVSTRDAAGFGSATLSSGPSVRCCCDLQRA